MSSATHAIASIITCNYIAQALTLYSYIKDSNPDVSHLVLIIGETDVLPQDLPAGPEWIYWDVIYDKEKRFHLAREYTPFELSCVARGRFHNYLATQREFDKWIMLDTDIGILANLDPAWEALDSACIFLTPHTSKPVATKQAVPHEGNILKCGLFNGGVVGMKRSKTSILASNWLAERLEAYGHNYPRRQGTTQPICHDFEFVDQIWLNLMYAYFLPETLVLSKEVYNLGHWNLHQGVLELEDGFALFNGERVLMAHFSGLPASDKLAQVSIHSQLYIDNQSEPWAIMASEYLDRLSLSKTRSPEILYSYTAIQPDSNREEKNQTVASFRSHADRLLKRIILKGISALKSPGKIIGGMKRAAWKLKRSCQIAQSIAMNKGKDRIFSDRSGNPFTNLVPCIGNYESYLIRASILQAVKQAKDKFHGRLLDVGAGSSPYEELIMENGNVSDYIKLDFAISDYHQGHQLDLTWDGKTIPLDSASIDTVFMTEVLEHVHKPGEMLLEIRRVLKQGGILFLTVPFTWPMHELPYDYHRFTPIALEAYLIEAGFDVKRIQLLGGWDHSLASQIGLWLTNSNMGERRRQIAKLLAWPVYSYLMRKGASEVTAIKNHQMYIGLAALAEAGVENIHLRNDQESH